MTLKLFGCTVKGFGTSIGWSSQPSTVRATLVRDIEGGEVFTPTGVGLPLTVEFGSLDFTGLVRNYQELASTDGLPTYEVSLEDPRAILEGTELILRDYNEGTFGVPNLLNVYGSLESTGFGNAQINDSGMRWDFIKEAVTLLTSTTLSEFGGPLTYKGFAYGVDLSQMPPVPTYYRIPGTSISLLRVIEQVCKDASCEFFVDFIPGTAIIRIRTVNLRLPPNLSVLANFIDQQTLSGICINSSKGLEMRNEPTSAFIVGGLQSTLQECGTKYQYFGQNVNNQPIIFRQVNTFNLVTTGTAQDSSFLFSSITLAAGASGTNNFYRGRTIVITSGAGLGQTRYIVSYNGTTKVAILDSGFAPPADNTSVYKIYQFVDPYGLVADLNCSEVADILGTNAYNCYMTEMLAALWSKNQWDSYVQNKRPALAAVFQGWRLPLNQQVGALPGIQLPLDAVNLGVDNVQAIAAAATGVTAAKLGEWKRQRVYDWLLTTINNHLGKTYLVPIPSLVETLEPDTLIIRRSHEPTNAGWLEGGAPGIPFTKQDLVTTEDGRIQCYCEFFAQRNVVSRATVNIDGGGIIFPNSASPIDDKYVGYYATITSGGGAGQTRLITGYSGTTKVGIPLNYFTGIDTDSIAVVYAPVSNLDLSKVNQRDAIILDGQSIFVKCQVEEGKIYNLTDFVNPDVPELVNCALVTLADPIFTIPTSAFGPDLSVISEVFGHIPENLQRTAGRGAGGRITWNIATPPANPFRFFVPLQSNTNTYGPWHAIGAQGKVSYRSDPSLVPWNYGGTAIMDLTAQAMVNDAISWANAIETGEVQLVGEPTLNLGDQLQVIGPVCTGMDIRYGQDGITTTYRFQTFSPKFGLFSFSNVERIKSLGLANQRIGREVRSILRKVRSTDRGAKETVHFAYKTWLERTGFWQPHSSHPVIVADSQPDIRDTNHRRVESALVSIGEMAQTWCADEDGENSEFTTKGSVSLAAIFRPFHTRLVGVAADGDPINLPDGIDNYEDLQMSAYWSADSQANYTYAMQVNTSSDNCIDPFQDGNDIELLLKGDTYQDAHNNITGSTGQNDQRVVCLKGPLVISGWGYCTDDAWVPNENPDTLDGDIVDDYLKKSHLWKTGPLEILWDDERGVWTGLGICMGKTVGVCAANGGTTTLNLYEDATTVITGRKKARTIYNFMSQSIPANAKVICLWVPEKRGWVITAADCT